MMKNKPRRRRSLEVPQNLECYFCKLEEDPSFKEVLKLRRLINDRGKILPKAKTGNCSRHQRMASRELKKARYLSLVPYTERHAL